MEYSIRIKKEKDLVEVFELNKSNLATVTVQFKTNDLGSQTYFTKLSMSKNAMLRFGKEIIRDAYSRNKIGHSHFYPTRPGEDITETLGIVLMPQSVEPIYWRKSIDSHDKKNELTNLSGPKDKNTYTFSIPKDKTDPEESQVVLDNIALFQVFDSSGNDISSACQYLIMSFSTQGAIGFGTEIIRLAHAFEDGKEVYIKNDGKQSMGIILQGGSCELVIKCETFEPVEKYIEQIKDTGLNVNADNDDFKKDLSTLLEHIRKSK